MFAGETPVMEKNLKGKSMKQYEKINWNEKTAEEVVDFLYDELEAKNQYPFFSWLMQNLPDLELDWLEIFEEIRNELSENEKIETVLSFIEWYKQKNPDDYRQRFEFIERDLCNYYLYKGDFGKLQARIAFIQQNPVPAIDVLTVRLLYQLIYHGQYQIAVSYAEAVWNPVNESDKLIGFAAYPFINTIYVSQLQKCYEAWLNNIYFDEDTLFRQIVAMGFSDNRKNFGQVLSALKGKLDIADINDSIKKGKDKHMLELNIHFLKYMLQIYNLPFIFSEWIWNFIATTKIFGKQKALGIGFMLMPEPLTNISMKDSTAFFS